MLKTYMCKYNLVLHIVALAPFSYAPVSVGDASVAQSSDVDRIHASVLITTNASKRSVRAQGILVETQLGAQIHGANFEEN